MEKGNQKTLTPSRNNPEAGEVLMELVQGQRKMKSLIEALLDPGLSPDDKPIRDLIETLILNQQAIIEDNHTIKANTDAIVRLLEDIREA